MKPQTKNALRVHVGLAIAETICITAFALELSRALSGNTLSWAYVFEWPVLGVYAVLMWKKLLSQDDAAIRSSPPTKQDESRLDAYNEYLNMVHQKDRTERRRERD